MKTFRMIGMALFAVLMCVNFAACSSSDDDEPEVDNESGVVTNGKKLIEIKEVDDDGWFDVYSLSYDSKGRLISIVGKESDSNSNDIISFTWGENTIIESYGTESITYSLTDNLIRKVKETDGCNSTFAYNSSKQLTDDTHTHSYGETSSQTYSWQGGKLVGMTYNDEYDNEKVTITYGNKTCKGFFPLAGFLVEDDYRLLLAHPELVGLRFTNLPSKIETKGEDYSYTETCSYTFDDDGYLESMTVEEVEVYSGETYTEVSVYNFKWE